MKLQIMMSTYNGEQYLEEQMESLLAQTIRRRTDWDVTIRVRDDGSTDGTCELLQRYANKYPFVQVEQGKNLGVVASFLELIRMTPEDVDYISLSDQDDVWDEDKVEIAVDALEAKNADVPLLYCGMSQPTDENLNPVSMVFFTEGICPSFGNALVENICTGCTAVCNRAMIDILRVGAPHFTVMHDWWMYLIATSFGEVVYDSVPHMLYRQHGDNTVGIRKNYAQEFFARLRRFKKNRYNISRQIMALKEFCENNNLQLEDAKDELLDEVLSAKKHIGVRIRMACGHQIHRQRKGDNLIFKFIFLSGTM